MLQTTNNVKRKNLEVTEINKQNNFYKVNVYGLSFKRKIDIKSLYTMDTRSLNHTEKIEYKNKIKQEVNKLIKEDINTFLSDKLEYIKLSKYVIHSIYSELKKYHSDREIASLKRVSKEYEDNKGLFDYEGNKMVKRIDKKYYKLTYKTRNIDMNNYSLLIQVYKRLFNNMLYKDKNLLTFRSKMLTFEYRSEIYNQLTLLLMESIETLIKNVYVNRNVRYKKEVEVTSKVNNEELKTLETVTIKVSCLNDLDFKGMYYNLYKYTINKFKKYLFDNLMNTPNNFYTDDMQFFDNKNIEDKQSQIIDNIRDYNSNNRYDNIEFYNSIVEGNFTKRQQTLLLCLLAGKSKTDIVKLGYGGKDIKELGTKLYKLGIFTNNPAITTISVNSNKNIEFTSIEGNKVEFVKEVKSTINPNNVSMVKMDIPVDRSYTAMDRNTSYLPIKTSNDINNKMCLILALSRYESKIKNQFKQSIQNRICFNQLYSK